jgi:hypothetical protein
MSDAMEDRGRALENEYFRRKEQELIQKMKEKMAAEAASAAAMKCPTGDGGTLIEADFENIKIDLCETCGGAWFAEHELEQLVKEENKGWFGRIFG